MFYKLFQILPKHLQAKCGCSYQILQKWPLKSGILSISAVKGPPRNFAQMFDQTQTVNSSQYAAELLIRSNV